MTKEIILNKQECILDMKRKVGLAFGAKMHEFAILTKDGSALGSQYDYDEIAPYKLEDGASIHVQRVSKREAEEELPTYIIANNVKSLETLIRILPQDDEHNVV